MITVNRNAQDLWNYLSDAWSKVVDKTNVEAEWETLSSGIERLSTFMMDVQNSRSLEYLPPIIEEGPLTYTFVCSGIEDLINVMEDPTVIFKYYLDDWILTIPTMEQRYSYLASGVDHVYIEGVDYSISGMNTLYWLRDPFWDERYTNLEVFTVSVPLVYRVNPVLLGTWARMVNIDIEKFNSYNIYKTNTSENKYKHLKFLIWALLNKQLEKPTIKILQDGLSIALGLPFAYEGGTVEYVYSEGIYTVTVGNEQYLIPSGFNIVASGTELDQFDLLVSGINVWDYYNNPTKIGQYTNALTQYNTLLIENNIENLTYNVTFYEDYRDKLLPIHFHKIYLGFEE
jgi:hypothetical protein